MVILAFAVLAGAMQSAQANIEAEMTRLGYYTGPVEAVQSGARITFFRDIPRFTEGLAGGQGGRRRNQPSPVAIGYFRNQVHFLLLKKHEEAPSWPSLTNTETCQANYLGERDGRHVYANGPMDEVIWIERKFQFSGGADWRDMAVRAIGARKEPGYRGPSGSDIFTKAGDIALPFLRSGLKQFPKASWEMVLAIGETQGPESTRELQHLYWDKDPEISRAAAYALIHKPFRKEAKSEYLDILAKGRYVEWISEAAVEFGWTEAVPPLEKVIANPENLHVLVFAIEAQRALSNKPVPANIRTAYWNLRSFPPKDVDPSKKALLGHADTELIAAYALVLSDFRTKADTTAANSIGDELIARLPSEIVQSIKARIKARD